MNNTSEQNIAEERLPVRSARSDAREKHIEAFIAEVEILRRRFGIHAVDITATTVCGIKEPLFLCLATYNHCLGDRNIRVGGIHPKFESYPFLEDSGAPFETPRTDG